MRPDPIPASNRLPFPTPNSPLPRPVIKKIINTPNTCASELLDGLVEAYDGSCIKVGRGCIVKKDIPAGKVALLVGGGSDVSVVDG